MVHPRARVRTGDRPLDARRRRLHRRVRRAPVRLHELAQVLARLIQLVLVQYDVEHLGRTLVELLGRRHLDGEVLRLGLAAGLDQPLQHLAVAWWGVSARLAARGVGSILETIQNFTIYAAQGSLSSVALPLHVLPKQKCEINGNVLPLERRF